MRTNMPKPPGSNPFKGRMFKIGLQFSLIAVVFIIIFAAFYACQASSKPKFDYDNVNLIQYKVPSDDTPVAVFETSKGTFKAVIYKDEVPNFAEYFIKLVNNGYYNGTHVFAVQKDVYFMGGSKAKDGTDTNDTNKDTMNQELSPNLWPFKGALISFGDKGGSVFNKQVLSGSRILFVNSVEFDDEFKKQLDSTNGNDSLIETFKEKGGVPNFSQQYTIFGHVYDGMDVYDKICGSDCVDSENLQPQNDITFDKVYMSTYGENKNDDFFKTESSSSGDSSSAVDSETDSAQ